jgi:glycosyltransferase involved in cell wall biosynthesis
MPRLYAAADAFVLPTRGEGFGMPIMEAMSMVPPPLAFFSGLDEAESDDLAYFPRVCQQLLRTGQAKWIL